jgi:cyclin-dependent kinase
MADDGEPPRGERLFSLVEREVFTVPDDVEELGSGVYGSVYALDERRVIKLSMPNTHGRIDYSLLREAARLYELDHPNVVRLLDVLMSPRYLAIVLPRAPETLETYAQAGWAEEDGVPLDTVKLIVLQVARGLAYLHSRSILQGDLKPDNVLVYDEKDCPLRVVITDLGIATTGTCYEKEDRTDTFAIPYRSPELLLGANYTEESDSWALGCVAVELLTGALPFRSPWRRDQVAYTLYEQFYLLGIPEVMWPGVTSTPLWDVEMQGRIQEAQAGAKAPPLPKRTPNTRDIIEARKRTRYGYTTVKGRRVTLDVPEQDFLNSLLVLDPAKRATVGYVARESRWLVGAREQLEKVPCQRESPEVGGCVPLLLSKSSVLRPSLSGNGHVRRLEMTDWMHECLVEARLHYRSLAIAVLLFRRYLSMTVAPEDGYDMFAAACIHLGSRLTEFLPVDAEEVLLLLRERGSDTGSGGAARKQRGSSDRSKEGSERGRRYTLDALDATERYVLHVVGIDLYQTTVYDLVIRYGSNYPDISTYTRRSARVFVLLGEYTDVEYGIAKDLVALVCLLLAHRASLALDRDTARDFPLVSVVSASYTPDEVQAVVLRYAQGLASALRGMSREMRNRVLTRQREGEGIASPRELVRAVGMLAVFVGDLL